MAFVKSLFTLIALHERKSSTSTRENMVRPWKNRKTMIEMMQNGGSSYYYHANHNMVVWCTENQTSSQKKLVVQMEWKEKEPHSVILSKTIQMMQQTFGLTLEWNHHFITRALIPKILGWQKGSPWSYYVVLCDRDLITKSMKTTRSFLCTLKRTTVTTRW